MVRFSAVLVINRILILVFVFWVWFLHSIPELGMFFFSRHLSRTIPTTTGWLINSTNSGIYFILTLHDSSRAHDLSVVNNCHSDHFFLPRARASATYQPSQPHSLGLFPRVVQYTQTESDWRRPSTTRLTGSQFARDLVNIHQSFCSRSGKCWQTDSIGSVGDGLTLQESIGLTASQFARDLVNIHQSGVVAGVENVGKRFSFY